MELRGNIIFPSHQEFSVSGLGCFPESEAATVAADLNAQADQMIRELVPGDMATFNRAAAIIRVASEVSRYIPGLSRDVVDLSIGSPLLETQRALYNPADESLISDEELRAFITSD